MIWKFKTRFGSSKLDLPAKTKRNTFVWKRGETTGSISELMAFNGLTAEALTKRAIGLVH
ncbi:hypothetical protein [Nostoc sp.]|uniref:hypothetical protein n=1 Tax=Nostoc sp. TaxID=1180 RepID=UPI002FFAC98B